MKDCRNRPQVISFMNELAHAEHWWTHSHCTSTIYAVVFHLIIRSEICYTPVPRSVVHTPLSPWQKGLVVQSQRSLCKINISLIVRIVCVLLYCIFNIFTTLSCCQTTLSDRKGLFTDTQVFFLSAREKNQKSLKTFSSCMTHHDAWLNLNTLHTFRESPLWVQGSFQYTSVCTHSLHNGKMVVNIIYLDCDFSMQYYPVITWTLLHFWTVLQCVWCMYVFCLFACVPECTPVF